jgi:peptidoglycan hydrolase-like protein with peptidoglycan-binding domain
MHMRIHRPACLVLLSALVGLGVPTGFAQQKAAKTSPRTSPKSKSSARPGSSAKSGSSAKTSPTRTNAQSKAHPAPASAASKSSGRKPSGKSAKASSRAKSRRQPGQKAPTSDRVTEIQSALAKDGSFAGEPNGKWDDSTTAAVRKFQSSHRLNPTGRLDAPTLQRLGLGSQTAGVAAPTPPPGTVSRLTSSILTAPAPDDTPQ